MAPRRCTCYFIFAAVATPAHIFLFVIVDWLFVCNIFRNCIRLYHNGSIS